MMTGDDAQLVWIYVGLAERLEEHYGTYTALLARGERVPQELIDRAERYLVSLREVRSRIQARCTKQ